MSELVYSWGEFFLDVKKLAEKIAPQKPESLLVVTKGGMFLGGMLSQYLAIPLIDTVCVESYKEQENHGIKVFKQASFDLPNALIVDEITDSGKTLQYLKEKYQARTAVLFHKPQTSVITPDYFLYETDEWVHFPWEVDPLT